MSDDAARRPLRIIPVAAPHAVPAAAQRQVERFQRALSPMRAASVDKPSRARSPASFAAPSTATGPREVDDGPHAATGAHAAASSAVAALGEVHARPRASAPTETTQLAEALPEAEPEASDEAGIDPDDGGTGGWDDGLVRLIVALCRQTDPAIEAWTVTVPLDAKVLPDTALELALSRHRLSLRFITQAVESHRLLSRQRNALANKLQRGLNSSREIDIEVN